jgi:hypothetical protein
MPYDDVPLDDYDVMPTVSNATKSGHYFVIGTQLEGRIPEVIPRAWATQGTIVPVSRPFIGHAYAGPNPLTGGDCAVPFNYSKVQVAKGG